MACSKAYVNLIGRHALRSPKPLDVGNRSGNARGILTWGPRARARLPTPRRMDGPGLYQPERIAEGSGTLVEYLVP
jgi:hypothetical protein